MLKVYLSESVDSNPRVQVSKTVRRLGPHEASQNFYSDNSILPVHPWHDVESSDVRYIASGPGDNNSVVTVVDLTDTQAVYAHDAAKLISARTRNVNVEELIREQLRGLVDYFVVKLALDWSTLLVGIHEDRPGLETVTIDSTAGHFIGLHVDSWSHRIGVDDRRGHVRVAINLGPAERHFLFCPRHLIAPGGNPSAEVQRAVSDFSDAADTGDIETVRVRISPGQAYIANTDIVFHDASSLKADTSAFSIQIRGQLLKLGS